MAKFIKSGKVVLVLQGKYAGKKALVVRQHDEGTKDRPYPHALVAGVARSPLRVTKAMGSARVARRTRIKSFVKVVNYNHLMPTRYSMDLDLKQVVTPEALADPASRSNMRKQVKTLLQERFATGKHRWFFQKLRI